ncbi:MAG: ANTAR domain-containing protein [Treponema sp.]|jgi:response regulator NasT|nr:ANTAR domain-containing protein [Treponema sp.]
MESALVVSVAGKDASFFVEMLNAASINEVALLHSCGEARKILLERDFDLVIVNAPLPDESGESLSRHIAAKGETQVILAVEDEIFDAVSSVCGNDGVLTISKPVNEALFCSSLALAKSVQNRIRRMQAENIQLKQKIEDTRVIDRAKWILISSMKMSEKDAHRFIEKQAMDLRATKREIAEGILKTYEN